MVMVKKRNNGDILVLSAPILYIISLFLPWVDVAFNGSSNGLSQRGYVVLVLFAYPIYSVIAKKPPRFFGLASSVSAVVFLFYYVMEVSQKYMEADISEAGVGLYLAILSSIILAVGVFIKMKNQSRENV